MSKTTNEDAAGAPEPTVADRFRAVWGGVAPPGRMFVGRLTGSRLYGTERPHSDWDWAGCYVGSTRRHLGTRPVPATVDRTKGDGTDWAFHEVGKFLAVLKSGNPNAVEALFAPEDAVVPGDPLFAPFWGELRAHRRLFLTTHLVHHTVAYATAQLARLRGERVRASRTRPDKPVDVMKDAAHGFRLLGEALRVAGGSEPAVRLTGGTREFALCVLNHEVAPQTLLAECDRTLDAIAARAPWGLPDEGPHEFADDWLQRVRLADLFDAAR